MTDVAAAFVCEHAIPTDPARPFDASMCITCWRKARGGETPRKATLPCVHAGEEAGPKGWHVCDHPDEPLGMVVCSCKGCGARCPGYSTGLAK